MLHVFENSSSANRTNSNGEYVAPPVDNLGHRGQVPVKKLPMRLAYEKIKASISYNQAGKSTDSDFCECFNWLCDATLC